MTWDPNIVERFSEIDGTKIRWIRMGQGDPVVLVHGSCASIYTWRHNLQALSENFEVYALDLPGFGYSEKPHVEYTPEYFAGMLGKFIEKQNLSAVNLVGSSMGGSISAVLALNSPHLVSRLVLIDPRVYASGPIHWMNKLLVTPVVGPLMIRSCNFRYLTGMTLRGYFHNPQRVTDSDVDNLHKPLKEPGMPWVIHSVLRHVDYSKIFAARAGQIKQPTLIIWGESDSLFPYSEGQRLCESMSQARFELIPEAGHLPHEERPEILNPLLIEFLKQLPTAERQTAQKTIQA